MQQEAIRRAIALADSLGGDDADTIMALVEMLAGQEWEDISSAPRDGSSLLAADADGWVGEVYWYDHFSTYMQAGPGWMIANCDSEYGQIIDATHWQPLPAPPQESEDGCNQR